MLNFRLNGFYGNGGLTWGRRGKEEQGGRMFEKVGKARPWSRPRKLTRMALALSTTSAPGKQGLHLCAFWSLHKELEEEPEK